MDRTVLDEIESNETKTKLRYAFSVADYLSFSSVLIKNQFRLVQFFFGSLVPLVWIISILKLNFSYELKVIENL